MQALTIFAGPICFTFTQRDESLFWLFLLLILWPIAVGVVYLFYRLVRHFRKKNSRPRSKLNSQLKKLTLSAYGLTVLLVVASFLRASREIQYGGSGCGEVVNNDLSNIFMTLSLIIFWVHIFLIIGYILEPFVNKNKS
jgi:hypothetical protein